MPTLFDPLTIGDLRLPNRVVMAPMTRSRADDAGVVGQMTATYYRQRAGAGLIISEAVNVSAMAKGYVRTPGLYTPDQIAAWKAVTDAVHAAGGRIFAQLFHTGRVALPEFLPGGVQPVAPSAIAAKGENYTDAGMKAFVTPRALETAEVASVAGEFAAAAKNAVAAGFDGVELHAASGYLVHQFLSAATNVRTDAYGGSLENRARFLLEATDGMIAAVGKAHVGVKLSPEMGFNDIGETNAEEMYQYVVKALSQRGPAYVHVGRYNAKDWHGMLKPLSAVPFMAGSGFDGAKAEAMLAAGGADAIVFGKLFVSNPDLPERLRTGAPLAEPDQSTFYTPGERGYTDYPAMGKAA